MQKINFLSDGNKLVGILSIPKVPGKIGVVFLHGGGHANFTRYKYLQERLFEKNISSLAFDMRGCGESEGDFSDSSLINREQDTVNALNFFVEKTGLNANQIYLWGSSMGAHVACKLCNKLQVRGLVLQSPATYGHVAESLSLGEEFTKEIGKPNSWVSSPAILELTKFGGSVLVVFGKNDTVIPGKVKKLYKSAIKSTDKFVILNGGIHTLLRPQNNDGQKALEQLGDIAVDFIC